MLAACQSSEPGTRTFSGEIVVGTETIFVTDADLLAGAREEKTRGSPAVLPVSYLDGSGVALKPLLAAVARGESEGIPFAGMKLRARFQGRSMGERHGAANPAIEVVNFEEVRVCPRLPQSLSGCSN